MPQTEGTSYIVGPQETLMVADARVEFSHATGSASTLTTLVARHVQWPEETSAVVRLALAVLQGDTGAALLLADLVQEQHTGRESELQAEVKRRVQAEVMAARVREWELCSAMMEEAISQGPQSVHWGVLEVYNNLRHRVASHLETARQCQ